MPDDKNRAETGTVATAIEQVLNVGAVGTLVTLIAGPAGVGAKLFAAEGGSITGTLGDASLDRAVVTQAEHFIGTRETVRSHKVGDFAPELPEWLNSQVLFERIQPEPRIVICGAGHVGASLARLATVAGYRVTLIDDRSEFLTRAQFPDEMIELVAATSWAVSVRDAIGNGRGVSVAVVTRGHNEDEECMRAAVATSADYIGLIGSKRRTNIVLNRLRESAADEERVKRVHAPIGLDIGAITPEEVALAILSEIVAERRGGSGLSLKAKQ